MLEEKTLGNMQLFMVAEHKPLGRETYSQGAEDSSAP